MPKVGRPPKPPGTLLEKRLTIPLHPDDFRWLEQRAERDGISIAAIIRAMITAIRREDER
jgi:hypothetical protein